jgi:lipase
MRLHVHRFGAADGPPLVFLHGIAGQGTRGRQIAEALGGRFRVIAPDQRGHGRSGWEPPWGLGEHIADVRETVAAEGIASAVWIGHSFGGRIISELDVPLVSRAVLVDPALQRAPADQLVTARTWEADTFATLEDAVDHQLRTGEHVGASRALIRDARAEELVQQPDGRLAERVFHPAVLSGVGEVARAWPGTPPRVPTLVLLGSESSMRIEGSLERYRSALGELLDVRTLHAGHSVLWDAPDEAFAAIQAFLADL